VWDTDVLEEEEGVDSDALLEAIKARLSSLPLFPDLRRLVRDSGARRTAYEFAFCGGLVLCFLYELAFTR